jgi:hypothetical protein
MAKTPAWQRKAGKNPKGGLNAKGRRSYNRATGGNLKAPSKKVGNKRRASFCARMKGMKKQFKIYIQRLRSIILISISYLKRYNGRKYVKEGVQAI